MDFLVLWVSVGIALEVVRRSSNHCCYPKKTQKPIKEEDSSLREPLLHDGKCLYNCCATLAEVSYESDAGASASESLESISEGEEEEEEEYSDSLIDKRKGKHLVKDDDTGEIVARIYPTGRGAPKSMHFRLSDNAKVETSAKVHPQPLNGTANHADASNENSIDPKVAKDMIQPCVASAIASDEHRLSPPLHEVMYHGHIPEGDEIQPCEGQCSYQAD